MIGFRNDPQHSVKFPRGKRLVVQRLQPAAHGEKRMFHAENAEKQPISVKKAKKLPKMGHFRAKNRKNCHFWPFLKDFYIF
ncbi:MAG: hypothetical protein EOM20_08640 [Spartobacteria bacterium]|nr:hypothetical protein [Spartobacteria bacterium]